MSLPKYDVQVSPDIWYPPLWQRWAVTFLVSLCSYKKAIFRVQSL